MGLKLNMDLYVHVYSQRAKNSLPRTRKDARRIHVAPGIKKPLI